MLDLPPGWATDLAVQRLAGAVVTEHGDHLVLQSPAQPTYHWGNCVLVLDDALVDDADRWAGVFAGAFPHARWVAIGLPRMPAALDAWTAHGLEVTEDESLTTTRLPQLRDVPAGYAVRPLASDDDWEQHVRREVAENLADGLFEPVGHEAFVRDRTAARRALSDRGVATWVGAFHDGALVADLGIVLCERPGGLDARYQAVGTDPAHRRRGLAGHLLGVAAVWAAERGATRWVIVTETTNPAGRLYRGVGFAPDAGAVQAYRRPALDT
jgi:GNAT superfamily N-acetyltransferase